MLRGFLLRLGLEKFSGFREFRGFRNVPLNFLNPLNYLNYYLSTSASFFSSSSPLKLSAMIFPEGSTNTL